MLIPSIDLRGGKVVQLVQGRDTAIESDDVLGWVERFERFPRVQVIDLDAAMGAGDNDGIVRAIAARLTCRVGGGVRTVARARELIEAGAAQVICGSALFSQGEPDIAFAHTMAQAIGAERLIAAIDSRGGRVVVDGWRTALPLAPEDAAHRLEPYCGEFLYTHVDTEGLMKGIDMAVVDSIRRATKRRISAAGGITTRAEIERLDSMGVDAVVGMALYTGKLAVDDGWLGRSGKAGHHA
ncbi:MAG: 1-(5-phosphoribosyl)-5-[(5-phosphoribosylamino)methylideneamino] imidazole-4-carboxamide isomerase [Acidobacteria bacterium]|nr:1-(5-phosphoribosyl)-5-[(5-phosphoribosylamino)methylideneamino] imidazole-4-carboxamide isomerase [Acidobacteriota bacterium]